MLLNVHITTLFLHACSAEVNINICFFSMDQALKALDLDFLKQPQCFRINLRTPKHAGIVRIVQTDKCGCILWWILFEKLNTKVNPKSGSAQYFKFPGKSQLLCNVDFVGYCKCFWWYTKTKLYHCFLKSKF